MKTNYIVDIHRLGCCWGTLPHGALRGAWKSHCEGKKFASIEEAATAMADMWYDLESDDVRAEMREDISDEEVERLLDREYGRIRNSIIFTWFYSYDDGECLIVRDE